MDIELYFERRFYQKPKQVESKLLVVGFKTLNMPRAKNPVESPDELTNGEKVTFWRSVGENMSKKHRGEVKDCTDEYAEIEIDNRKSTLSIKLGDIEKPTG